MRNRPVAPKVRFVTPLFYQNSELAQCTVGYRIPGSLLREHFGQDIADLLREVGGHDWDDLVASGMSDSYVRTVLRY